MSALLVHILSHLFHHHHKSNPLLKKTRTRVKPENYKSKLDVFIAIVTPMSIIKISPELPH